MMPALSKKYEPSEIEQKIYRFWMDRGYFRCEESSDRPSFCIVLPPPNITGALHMGHALTATIQDMLIRWRRMQGYNTIWLPGTDHAGIATQMVVERQLEREGKDRHELGREHFVKRVWQWKEEKGGRITEQHKRLGASLDWERERFTLDEGLSRAVIEAFVRLYEEGLVYRASRLINWCPSCRSAISDLEVDREKPEQGEMWRFAYEFEDGSGEIIVATTRPETMLGDTAVAVHPDDERYCDLIGRNLKHPFVNRMVPVIADSVLADPELGTGAVKVTPAHDINDFECGMRNDLEFINILNPDATLNENAGPFAGMDRFEGRDRVKEELEKRGLARGSDPHMYAPGRCYRHPDTIVEPMLSLQWFVKTEPLAAPAAEAVRDGRTTFVPKDWDKTYFHWLDNIQDWCISRQLWWGHRIPAWYCGDCNGITVAAAAPEACSSCGSKNIHQDEDVLDTWFSSALWPFSTLGWPDGAPLLKTFYPNSVMETGYDIIFFWVARMMMMGMKFMGDVPFHKVLIHAMVRDGQGKKMSKATGNVIDPIDVIDGITLDGLIEKLKSYNLPGREYKKAEKETRKQFPSGINECGCDALRFTLAAYTAQGRDIKLSLDRVQGYRRFGNKIWQVIRGVLHPRLEGFSPGKGCPESGNIYDRWILSRLHNVIEKVNRGLEEFEVDQATSAIYQFIWHELCDWYVEIRKSTLNDTEDSAEKHTAVAVLYHCIEVGLRLLHPFMPFITEELWQSLVRRPGDMDSIMISAYPDDEDAVSDEEAQAVMNVLMEFVTAVRSIRSDYGVPPSAEIEVIVVDAAESLEGMLEHHDREIRTLINASGISLSTGKRPRGAATAVVAGCEVAVPLAGVVDAEKESARLEKDVAKVLKETGRIEKRLNSRGFVEKAPPDVVARERQIFEEMQTRKKSLENALERLGELEKDDD